jgi:glutaminyl-tRNA synthetase
VLEIGYNEVHQKAPWPAEHGESKMAEKESKSSIRPESVRFQGVRVGYFCVDSDSTPEKLVLNQITTLKDSAGKV